MVVGTLAVGDRLWLGASARGWNWFLGDGTAGGDAGLRGISRVSDRGSQPGAMKTFARWKVVVLLLLVFVAGGVVGGVATYVFTKRALEAAFDFDRWPDRGVRILDDRLGLDPEQKIRVREIQERMARQMKEQFHQSLTESGRILLEFSDEIDVILTPEQRAIHAAMKDELRAGFRQHFGVDLSESEPSAGADSRTEPEL
jgi:hypothetical protein